MAGLRLTNLATPRRWTVIGSGLLCGILAVIVLFTNPRAFASPLAVVVLAAIGLAAVLLQLRMLQLPELGGRSGRRHGLAPLQSIPASR